MLSRKTVKYIQSLSRKKFRDIHHRFIAETPKVVNEFLNSSYKTESIYGTEDWFLQNKAGISEDTEFTVVDDDDLRKITQLKNAHSVLAVIEIPEPVTPIKLKDKITLAVDDIQDPGNMGTIIRIADWFGVKDIIANLHTADEFSPKVVQSSMGSLSRVNVLKTNLGEFFRNASVPVFATTLDGRQLRDLPPIREGIILTGNEGKGIDKDLLDQCTQRITIPRYGGAESLNAAVATGIILSHVMGASK